VKTVSVTVSAWHAIASDVVCLSVYLTVTVTVSAWHVIASDVTCLSV